MDIEVNISCITLGGYVELNKYRYFYFSIMFTVYMLIIFSNSVIVYLIWSNKSLHEPMYIFIAALLFNSILYSTTVYPKLLIDFLSEKQIISYSACIFQFFMFYSVGGSEFILLAVMAFDRYASICKPLRYPIIMRKSTVNVFLILAWILPACPIAIQAILSTKAKICNFRLNGVICNNVIYAAHCVKSRAIAIFGVAALLVIIILPMLFTVFTYANIFIMFYRSCRTFQKKIAETCIPHLLVLISYFCLMAYDVIVARLESDFPQSIRFIMTLQIFLYHPLFNPFIYGIKMKEIFKHLKRLFCSGKI
ncbi:olfactory receptor 11H2-like [Austrofundulus limnaeus]|uniref:Olfactory receptor n=1 Tax=Austrofundulus limnaeus TaxID=52670 RepID=A0A2I4CH03_AUSLI|nr:PREDICTED: olfactory receptor 11H2-like [Austrofundulus limnaeus]